MQTQDYVLQTKINNYTKKEVRLIDSHFWIGQSLTSYPSFPNNGEKITIQGGCRCDGIKFGLAYGHGHDGPSALMFIVAFHGPANKAYVEVGPMGPVDWNRVESKLSTGNKNARQFNQAKGAQVHAEINGDNASAILYYWPQEFIIQSKITNNTNRPVHLIEKHFWRGFPLTTFPPLPVTNYADTVQGANSRAEGTKFGLVFADGVHSTSRKFLIAFDSPAGKVYVEAGPTGPINWNTIEAKLNRAGRKTEHTNTIQGASVVAEMIGDNPSATFYNTGSCPNNGSCKQVFSTVCA